MKIVSIDFETANYSHASICAAGMAVFEDDILCESFHWLVRPPCGHGFFREDFVQIHGIQFSDVQNAPEFLAIAPEFMGRLAAADVIIAHNASFDVGKLRGTLNHFGLLCPELNVLCTCALSRRVWPELPNHQLSTVVSHIGETFQHHNAQDDAVAAGWVLGAILKQTGIKTLAELSEFSRRKVPPKSARNIMGRQLAYP